MEVISDWKKLSEKWKHGACALGTFDGIHRGHQTVISRAVEYAKEQGVPSVVFTFSNHPRSVVSPDKAPLFIEDAEVRRMHMKRMGVDMLFEPLFTEETAAMEYKDFLKLLKETLAPSFVAVGPNYTFGRMGAGSADTLKAEGENFGFTAGICSPVFENDEMISSTGIRRFIRLGKLDEANKWLGHPVTAYGEVMHGDARGRLLGFPTANLELSDKAVSLPKGVYAVRVTIDGEVYGGAANIGSNPTFGIMEPRLEVHVLDFSGNLYGKKILVEFLKLLRREEKFPSIQALIAQMEKDKAKAEEIFRLQADSLVL